MFPIVWHWDFPSPSLCLSLPFVIALIEFVTEMGCAMGHCPDPDRRQSDAVTFLEVLWPAPNWKIRSSTRSLKSELSFQRVPH